jgi:glycosyltransferase involved in cell wall biosynthesis
MQPPKVSVIVCSYNGEGRIRQTLESLQKQSYKNMEVIVVDDGSTDGTSKVAKEYDFKLIRFGRNRGLAVARNQGVKESTGEIVVFTDDDCVADKDWIKNLTKTYAENPEAQGVGGRIEAYSTDTLLEKYAYFTRHPIYVHRPYIESHHRIINYLRDFLGMNDSKLLKDGQKIRGMMGANSSFRRSIIEEVGERDEQFRNYGEDWDLNIRLSKIGASLIYSDKAVIRHKHRTIFKSFIKHMFKYGEVYYTMHKKHKEVGFLLPLIPALFIIFLAVGLISNNWNFLIFLTGAYFLLSLPHSIKTFKRHRSIRFVLTMPVIDFIRELSYFLGSIAGVILYRASLNKGEKVV